MSPERQFAIDVVKRLTEAGFQALWAGGCVRDALLEKTPKDYDVATNATPTEVIELFGNRRTIPVGESFGVVVVLGPQKLHGQIEVATFRRDGDYSDGRRPETVEFCDAEEDAKRRDFTINGMFFDPLNDRVHDYVGGQQDLKNRLVRAIGDPTARITEDKLRMLRAVRFAATFSFDLDTETKTAIRNCSDALNQVSAERIAQEMRRMMSHSSRSAAVEMLQKTGLWPRIFPELNDRELNEKTLAEIDRLTGNVHEPTFAHLFAGRPDQAVLACRRLRFSNEETNTISWLVQSAQQIQSATDKPLHILKPILADPRWPLLRDLDEATSLSDCDHSRHLLELTKEPHESLNPPELLNGQDLKAMGIEPGPIFKQILTEIRNRQLDEEIETPEAARKLAAEIYSANS